MGRVIWQTIEPLLPPPDMSHPLGCHRPRVPDEVCFRGILIRLVTGSSWVDIEAILGFEVSDTTLRARRDEWIDAGVFDTLAAEALAGYDRIIELDLDLGALDGSIHKAPCGGEGTGKSPVDRGELGWKWSVACDGAGIPIGVAIDGANGNDLVLLEPTLDAIEATGLLADIGTLSLDRGYDYPVVRGRLEARGLTDLDIQKRGTKPKPGEPHRLTLGLRWIAEATNTWLSNYGQLRRSTDRRERHRHAAIRLATAVSDHRPTHRLPKPMEPGARVTPIRSAPKGGILRRSFEARLFRPAVKEAGLPENLTFHGLRHVATTLMIANNEHPKVIQHRLGHADPAMSLGVYGHVPDDLDQAAAVRLDDLFRPKSTNEGSG